MLFFGKDEEKSMTGIENKKEKIARKKLYHEEN